MIIAALVAVQFFSQVQVEAQQSSDATPSVQAVEYAMLDVEGENSVTWRIGGVVNERTETVRATYLRLELKREHGNTRRYGEMMKEISNLTDFASWAAGSPEKEPAAIQDLDLGAFADVMNGKTFPDSIFLSCDMKASVAGHVVQSGGIVIPDLKGFSFGVHRKSLYSVDELFAGFDLDDPRGYEATYDFKAVDQHQFGSTASRPFGHRSTREGVGGKEGCGNHGRAWHGAAGSVLCEGGHRFTRVDQSRVFDGKRWWPRCHGGYASWCVLRR